MSLVRDRLICCAGIARGISIRLERMGKAYPSTLSEAVASDHDPRDMLRELDEVMREIEELHVRLDVFRS